MMRRILPHPLLSLLLLLVWVMLVNVVTLNAIVFGVIVGILIPMITAPYWPDMPKLRNPLMIAEFILVVIWDILMANIHVARIIVFKRNADMQPRWITVPLDIRTPEAITVLAGTITMTPGTVSSDLASDGRSLLVHCLDAPDPDAVIAEIKTRYERRLKEIFE
ncbi:Na+/H+ antiporter subunit E [Roseicitreum antarcticum]|uniref:Multisubunit potassium/proton antiporter, PhaE subunit n=1 Tax=Roseicitreum antarcticum TaxID=564137 RepID=A0A1H2RQM6_9RHOB|nr:Na+/H+ antiporter subunit E [Roseicitreum antarcticum]SDW21637.1 multisubunit potassium/proton antiporter, PhaE subunit [Roseicitreum antarcticum]